MSQGVGRHAGVRVEAESGGRGRQLMLAVSVTACAVGWGLLVRVAIDAGRTARAGDPTKWLHLGLASLGAAVVLFAGLLLVTRLLRQLGILSAPTAAPRVPGRRVKR